MDLKTAAFDRRLVYRPFLERLTPEGLALDQALIVVPDHDPRDPDQPPIHEAFAMAAELQRGVQMALVGGIGSGKTTQMRLTSSLLGRHNDAITVFVDLADLTDLNSMNPGAILIAIGMKLFQKLSKAARQTSEIKTAYLKLKELATGRTDWVEQYPSEFLGDDDDDDSPGLVPVNTPGLLKPRFPAIDRTVSDILNLLIDIAIPILMAEHQVTVLIDGLDRLIRPERFREFVEQDLRALRELKISVIVAAPLLTWYDKTRFLQDSFDDVKHLPAAISDPEKSTFLKEVLLRRGAGDLMAEQEVTDLARLSGGVLRDLITLARTSAEAAYRDDEDRIGPKHVLSASRQMGRRYLLGLGKTHKNAIVHLLENEYLSLETTVGRDLLVNRQVLEYCTDGRDFFAVHPALAQMLREAA